jgi:hypothetical protein
MDQTRERLRIVIKDSVIHRGQQEECCLFLSDVGWQAPARIRVSNNPVKLVVVILFSRDKQQTAFGVIEGTQLFQYRVDRSSDPKMWMRKNRDLLKELQSVSRIELVTSPTRDHVAKNQELNQSQEQMSNIEASRRRCSKADYGEERGGSESSSEPGTETRINGSDNDWEEQEKVEHACGAATESN